MKVYDYNQEFGGNYYQVRHFRFFMRCLRNFIGILLTQIYFALLSIHLILSNSAHDFFDQKLVG